MRGAMRVTQATYKKEAEDLETYLRTVDLIVEYVKERTGDDWWKWPTIRELAIKFRRKQDDIIDIVEAHDNLDLIVGMSNYNGYGEFELKGDYRVEWYE